jgi:hypothetical protein
MGKTHRVGLTDHMREPIGTARLDRTGACTAGACETFRLACTAGRFGVDDTGGILVTCRFASDMGEPCDGQRRERRGAGALLRRERASPPRLI